MRLILKDKDPMLANTYLEIGNLHLSIYDKLHSKQDKANIPVGMIEIWDYEHTKLIDEYNELKYKYSNAR